MVTKNDPASADKIEDIVTDQMIAQATANDEVGRLRKRIALNACELGMLRKLRPITVFDLMNCFGMSQAAVLARVEEYGTTEKVFAFLLRNKIDDAIIACEACGGDMTERGDTAGSLFCEAKAQSLREIRKFFPEGI